MAHAGFTMPEKLAGGGWRVAVPSLLGVAVAVESARKFGERPNRKGALFNVAAFVISRVLLIICARPGDPYDNKYGPV